jgi:hypothetical protein
MGLLITVIFSLALWVVLWAINLKSFDGFLIAMFFIVLAASARLLAPYLPGSRHGEDD